VASAADEEFEEFAFVGDGGCLKSDTRLVSPVKP
jgi:hypothetical protein